jgi:hypothetical protein
MIIFDNYQSIGHPPVARTCGAVPALWIKRNSMRIQYPTFKSVVSSQYSRIRQNDAGPLYPRLFKPVERAGLTRLLKPDMEG